MKDIFCVESIASTPRGIVVTVLVEDVNSSTAANILNTVPSYAPIRCTITVPFFYLPEQIDFNLLDEDELEQLLNVNVNLNEFEWVPVINNRDDDKKLGRAHV